ncbi:MAG: P-loop NTPase [Firmicutes bacterium]|nr:P-loop NTPase [Bacillota bacterium]
MKEFLIISGKGGTGKTSITAAFAALAGHIVLADCDVDTANLHLLLKPVTHHTEEFVGSQKASIDPANCTNCGLCQKLCRFEAINQTETARVVDQLSCEGCGVCSCMCPQQAITMQDHVSGHWFISDTQYGPMVHARLGIAEENSGKLVAKVREHAQRIAAQRHVDYILVDGPPGTGCPVISSISGVDLALIVTEPTITGMHDLLRVKQLADHFGVEVMVCINKYDLDEACTKQIETYCEKQRIEVAGHIPFDKNVVSAQIRGLSVADYQIDPAASSKGAAAAIKNTWQTVSKRLQTLPG